MEGNRWQHVPLNLVRGALIGTAEAIPGVSGGTMALVTGVYDRVIAAAGDLLSAVRLLVSDVLGGNGSARGRDALRRIDWHLVVPLLAGMFTALLVALLTIAPLIDEYPEQTRAVFFGMIAASIAVPLRAMRARLRTLDVVLIVIAAATAGILTGMPENEVDDPSLWLVFAAAAVAINAMVLPGVSGAFLLTVFGLYVPVTDALHDRDMTVVGVFALGAAVGLISFIKGLQWLLEHRHQATMAVLVGLMIGSLRALWPWQDDDRAFETPSGNIAGIVVLAVAGAAVVAALIVVEIRRLNRTPAADAPTEVIATGDESRFARGPGRHRSR